MLHYYDSCPYSPADVESRLEAARALSAAGIPSLVWGEDALAFIHFVPTHLFALHLVVTEASIPLATKAITDTLPYEVITDTPDWYRESLALDPAQPRIYPNTVHLRLNIVAPEETPEFILLHPQSDFYLDITDTNRSVPLSPFPSNIRFPTRTAFIDSVIATHLDPPNGRYHSRLMSALCNWLAYFFIYTLRTTPPVLPTGELEPELKELLQSLRPENRLYFDAYARDGPLNWDDHVRQRKEILKKLGRHEEASRPLAILSPGNPELRRVRLLAQQQQKY